jgi:hypothetical protein
MATEFNVSGMHPYRMPDRVEADDAQHLVASEAHLLYVRRILSLQRWLRVQVGAHTLVLLSYGVLLALATPIIAFHTVGVGGLCCVAALISAKTMLMRSYERLTNLWEEVPVVESNEWMHYVFCTLVCAGLCSFGVWVNLSEMSIFYLPALAFCIYSLLCLRRVNRVAGLYVTRG